MAGEDVALCKGFDLPPFLANHKPINQHLEQGYGLETQNLKTSPNSLKILPY